MYTDQPSPSHHHPHLACPHCGHNSVVQHGNVYICLNCNFQRNVSEPGATLGLLPALGITVLVWFMVQLAYAPPQTSTPLSPPIDQGEQLL
jgi:DNA-directed RNA polymerase subunit RPC12/RpoP